MAKGAVSERQRANVSVRPVGPADRPSASGATGAMTVKDAGRKGGERGGQTTKERYGSEFYREIGRRGGETVRQIRGREFYEDIGRKGGQKVRELINAAKKAE